MQEKSGNLSAKFLIFFTIVQLYLWKTFSKGGAKGKRKPADKSVCFCLPVVRLLMQGGLFDGEIFACCFAVQIDGDGIISCGKKLACVEVELFRIFAVIKSVIKRLPSI